ncbi:uncharacterized protein LOC110831288 isoform X1 [Zootermopsis nevadensis]|uniref:F-box domain-containing protein n=1 Tax=Zootermopsis nevadensis TaxID=136037 RepID=A0A067R4H6_ZOONE|nr:uncharacterized protein LOC110831288 isoform X1 [Zootermopsis nevadensis]KDR17960.1 hypothetical protein L798_08178 [Zootermopsis nevadensis]
MNKFIRCIKSKIKRDNEGPDKVGACSRQLRQLHITDLPPEVLALIFEHCSYDVLGRQVRLVCKRFCDVATSVLNCGFSTLGPKIDRAMADAVSLFEEGRTLEELLVTTQPFTAAMVDVVPRIGQGRTTEQQMLIDQHYIALMIMKWRYRLLRAATGRYIYSPYSGSGHLACFYAGSLLDEFLRFLRVACHSPTLLGSAMLNPDFGNEVYKLCVRCSIFMNHFKKRTEKFERDYSISGAKLIDLYCGLMKRHVRMTPHEQAVTVNGTECHIEANYRMPYTWFNCLPSSNAQPNQWSEEPRSIYLRTRQLINDRNHFFLEKIHHEKELLIRKVPYILTLKYIIPSLYNAFHQNYGYLFFYGTMDRSTYDHNSHVERSPTVQLFHYFNLDFFTSRNESDKSDGVVNVPQSSNMDLNIDMELHSRLRLAPIRFSDNSLAYIWPSAVIVGGYRQIRFK